MDDNAVEWSSAKHTRHLFKALEQQVRLDNAGMPAYPIRKLRLLNVAAIQRIAALFNEVQFPQVLVILERFADQKASAEELEFATNFSKRFDDLPPLQTLAGTPSLLEGTAFRTLESIRGVFAYALRLEHWPFSYCSFILGRVCQAFKVAQQIDRLQIRPSEIKYLAAYLRSFLNHFQASGWQAVRDPQEEERYQCDLIRDVFQHPERPTQLEPTWLTANVVALAQTIYDQKHFHLMPILTDALQDAGCENETILQHCQHPVHVRGCWLIDLLLGKT